MPRGCQEPTFALCATWTRSQGDAASALADAYGTAPLPWQRAILRDWLAIDERGRLLNSLCVLPVPRQNGKTGVCDPRETLGLIVRHEHILHTAQEYQTARAAFDRLREKFGEKKSDPRARYPELNALVKKYTTSANQMILELVDGGRIEFRTRGSKEAMGRGGTFDLVVIDEAQAYTDEQEAALGPLNSAAPHGSPQTIFMGTVPEPGKVGGVFFRRLCDSTRASRPRSACMHEWSAPEVGDKDDRERWYRYNPSLGYHLLERAFDKDVITMSPETFAREHLGWWPPISDAERRPIPLAAWDACRVSMAPDSEFRCLGVKFSPDGMSGSVSVCVVPEVGPPHVEAIACRPMAQGLDWFVERIGRRWRDFAGICIDGQSNAQALNDRLLAEGVPHSAILRPQTRDVIAANGSLLDAVRCGALTHVGQAELDASATMCVRRPIGKDGGWGFSSTDKADATIVESVALALWATQHSKRDPRRKAKVG